MHDRYGNTDQHRENFMFYSYDVALYPFLVKRADTITVELRYRLYCRAFRSEEGLHPGVGPQQSKITITRA